LELPQKQPSKVKNQKVAMIYEGKCDICEHGDNHWGHVLQKCKECSVLVHEACYGLEQSKGGKGGTKRLDWVCRACELKHLQPDGKRASRCVLCSVSGGVHAMHPIYDKEGPDGKQVMRPSGPAWAHTLCCVFLGSHRKTEGCVFACNKNGRYDGESDEGDTDEENDDEGEGEGEESNGNTSSIEAHHFVICRGGLPSHKSHFNLLQSYRKELKCSVCHVKDSAVKILRIPVQCCTGDEDEQVFASCHKTGKECWTATHVGCARWKVDSKTGLPPIHPRVFFWPGALDVDDGDIDGPMAQPIAEIYCGSCAAEISRHRKMELKQTAPSDKKKTKSLTKAGVDDDPKIGSKEKSTEKVNKKSKDAKPSSKSKEDKKNLSINSSKEKDKDKNSEKVSKKSKDAKPSSKSKEDKKNLPINLSKDKETSSDGSSKERNTEKESKKRKDAEPTSKSKADEKNLPINSSKGKETSSDATDAKDAKKDDAKIESDITPTKKRRRIMVVEDDSDEDVYNGDPNGIDF